MYANVKKYRHGGYIIKGQLVQCDWDYPAEACAIGWNLTRVQWRYGEVIHLARRSDIGCDHNGTDGTVKCPHCGIPAIKFIQFAAEYLDARSN